MLTPTPSLLSVPQHPIRPISRSCDNILSASTSTPAADRRQSRMSDIVNVKEWRRRHKIRGFKDNKGFVWKRWIPDEVAHQRPPKPHIIKQQSSDNEDSIEVGEGESSNSCSSLDSFDETIVSTIVTPEQPHDILNNNFILSELLETHQE